jgi:hypothetical protein
MASSKTVRFIVEADVPALLFSSQERAERYLEAVDIDGGVYPAAFDADGRVYDIVPHDGHGCLVPRNRTDKGRLRQVLARHLRTVGLQVSDEESLSDLLRKCDSYLDE